MTLGVGISLVMLTPTHINVKEYILTFVSEPSRKMGRNKSKFFVVNGIFLPTFLFLVAY